MNGRFLVFETDYRRFALRLEQAAEVLESPPRFPLPLTPPFLAVGITVNGTLVPVLDLALLLGGTGVAADSRVLVLAGEGTSLAIQIDRVLELIDADGVSGERPSEERMFTSILDIPGGETPLLCPERLLQLLEQVLGGSSGAAPLNSGTNAHTMPTVTGVPQWT